MQEILINKHVDLQEIFQISTNVEIEFSEVDFEGINNFEVEDIKKKIKDKKIEITNVTGKSDNKSRNLF